MPFSEQKAKKDEKIDEVDMKESEENEFLK
jgi:hypothetical protein